MFSSSPQGLLQINENVAACTQTSESVTADITQSYTFAEGISDDCDRVEINATDLSKLAAELKQTVGRFKI